VASWSDQLLLTFPVSERWGAVDTREFSNVLKTAWIGPIQEQLNRKALLFDVPILSGRPTGSASRGARPRPRPGPTTWQPTPTEIGTGWLARWLT
jgi:hypothetical protein